MSELLPCPFCGGKAKLIHDTSSDYRSHWDYFVECQNWSATFNAKERTAECGANTPSRKTAEDAIAVWNRRYDLPNKHTVFVASGKYTMPLSEQDALNKHGGKLHVMSYDTQTRKTTNYTTDIPPKL